MCVCVYVRACVCIYHEDRFDIIRHYLRRKAFEERLLEFRYKHLACEYVRVSLKFLQKYLRLEGRA